MNNTREPTNTTSIKKKLIKTQFYVASLVLFTCSVTFFVNEVSTFKRALERNLTSTAHILGQNLTSSIVFSDKKEAEKILSSLRSEPNLISAFVFDVNGKVFAKYGNETPPEFKTVSTGHLLEFSENYLLFYYGLQQNGDALGTLFIKSNSVILKEEYKKYFLIALLVLAFGLMLSLTLANWIQRSLTGPIINLAETAKDISISGNYSLRTKDGSTKQQITEIVVLEDEFNKMLDQIQLRTAELHTAQEQALTNAHSAGMAEISTGILHNIGNTINSVNISADEISQTIANSSLAGFLRANQILSENLKTLPEFLTSNAKGKLLPEYYLVVGNALSAEHERLKREITSIVNKLTLINDIVSTQQDYSKNSVFYEEISIAQITEEILVMQASSLSRHSIQIIKNFREVPLVVIQRVKFAHVLMNLIRNARDGMKDNPPHNRVITLEIGQLADLRVFMKVSDNGMGIPMSNLAKIFNHGFTTKTDGHGFGLHFCANAMTEMGGQISVESPGPGNGATFSMVFQTAETKEQCIIVAS